jgi:hypothetical protein
MRQPDFHAGELPQHGSELFEDAIACRTQPWIMGREIHAFLLGQCFTGMLKEVLLLNACRTLHPQIDDAGQFVGGEAFAPNQFHNVGLVARGQPHQLPCGGWRQQSHL